MTIKEQASVIVESRAINAQLECELDRVKKLTWFDHLLGKK